MALVAAGSVYYELSRVRADVTSARDTLEGAFADPASLRTPGGRATARTQVDRSVETLSSARRRAADSELIALLRFMPTGATQRRGLVDLIEDATNGAKALSGLLGSVDSLVARTQLTDGRLPTDGMAELSADVRAAAGLIQGAARPTSGLWGPIGDARDRFDKLVLSSTERLRRGADALDVMRSFTGGNGDRRYFLALMNNAEMRDQGMVLSYAIVDFSGGRISLERSGSEDELTLDRATSTVLPSGTKEVFGALQPTTLWQSVNATADFALTGRTITDMYLQKTGQRVDGVIGVDVPGVSALLRSLGPVNASGIAEPVDAGNVSRIVLHDLYQGVSQNGDQSGRRELLGAVTRAVIEKVTQGTYDALALGQLLGDAAKGGHFRLWSESRDEEKVFERSGIGGGPAVVAADRTFHVAIQNRTATKLDYYVKPSVRQDVELRKNGTAVVRTTVVVDNQAPRNGAPSYQLGPDPFTEKPGDYKGDVLLWGPAGATQDASTPESGLIVAHHVVPVSAGNSIEVSFETVIPSAVRGGRLTLRLVPQSRLEPMALDVRLSAPGWKVTGPSHRSGPWDRVWTLDWRIER